ncbi:hypothetical protein AB5J62_29925 [Amycolatopsis sp. cg5]
MLFFLFALPFLVLALVLVGAQLAATYWPVALGILALWVIWKLVR